jgi:RES domain-containing protein
MITFRIAITKYAGSLLASGNPARWNSKDVKVIYTAGSRSLACLENVVHRSSLGLKDNFRIMQIEIPGGLLMDEIKISSLDPGWRAYNQYPYTQALGDEWVNRSATAVLKVPSAIIPEEFNYLLNPLHRDFHKIKYLGSEPFDFDERIKAP